MAKNGTKVGETQVEAVRRTCRYIEANLETSLTLAALGEHANISPSHLQRLFKRITGITPRQYADACRLGRLKTRLKERRTVTMALFEAGYGSTSRLYERSSGQLGMTPAAYQRGGPAVKIRYTVLSCPLGRLLLAATERGVCSVCIGDEDAPLEACAASRIPRRGDRPRRRRTQSVGRRPPRPPDGRTPHLNLPIDVAPPPSSGASGRNCSPSPTAAPGPIRRSPGRRVSRRRRGRWPAPVRPIPSPC